MSRQQPLQENSPEWAGDDVACGSTCSSVVGRVRAWAQRLHSSFAPTLTLSGNGLSEGTSKTTTSSSHNEQQSTREEDVLRGQNWMEWQPSPHDKNLLRSTWSDDFETLYQLGSDIYTFIFDHNPACKELFPWTKLYEGDKWKDSTQFRQQALRFVQTIAQVVKNVYHMERLQPLLYGIGQKHVQYASRGFQPHYWDAFQDAMEHALTHRMQSLSGVSDDDRHRAVEVWRDIALYIIQHMKSGYEDGLKGINRFPPLNAWT